MTDGPASMDAAEATKLRRSQIWAALFLYVESLVLVLFTAYLFWGFVSGQAKSVPAELGQVLLFFIAAISLERAAKAVLAGKRWGRSWSVFWQTAQIFLATQSVTGEGANWFIGSYLALSAIGALIPLFTPAAIANARREMNS